MEGQFNYQDIIKRTVMVVDDELVNREILGAILEESYTVLFAEDGEEALAMLGDNANVVSAVLLDLLMPKLDGFAVMERMKADPKMSDIPVIVLTSEKSAEVKSLRLGAADFIKKPYDEPEVIRARVDRIIELADSRMIIKSAEWDEFTGLLTSPFFYEYGAMMNRYNPARSMDMLVLDVEHFHLLNELYGREFGDKVLLALADVIQKYASEHEGIAAHKEADIFMLYIERQPNYQYLVDSLMLVLSGKFKNARTQVRIGVCPRTDTDESLEKLFNQARMACNTLRGQYSKSVAYYDFEFHKKVMYSERLIHDIHDGIKQKQFKVFFQPKFGIQGDKPRMESAEALVRWVHPELGMVSPGAFIPLFEKNGLIQQVDYYVWREAAAKIRQWRDAFGITVPVSVNMSRIDMMEPKIVEKVLSIVQEFDLQPEDLHLEITESAYADDANRIIEVVDSFRKHGFIIEMDDFGTGYSSLNMLSDLHIDILKIDMKFIRTIATEPMNLRMVEMILDIAGFLCVPVVAEGVEDEKQYALLKERGCSFIQGYYFSKPLPEDEFERFVKERAAQTDAKEV